MFSQEARKIHDQLQRRGREPKTLYKDGIFIGRLDTCEVVLDDKTVSRIHAAINYRDAKVRSRKPLGVKCPHA